MKKEYYYIVSVSCNSNSGNKKEKAIAVYLKGYKDCIVDEEYTTEVLIDNLNKRIDEINATYKRCMDIRLKRENGMYGEIIFEFESDARCNTHPAIMVLRPVRRWLTGSSSLRNCDAE